MAQVISVRQLLRSKVDMLDPMFKEFHWIIHYFGPKLKRL